MAVLIEFENIILHKHVTYSRSIGVATSKKLPQSVRTGFVERQNRTRFCLHLCTARSNVPYRNSSTSVSHSPREFKSTLVCPECEKVHPYAKIAVGVLSCATKMVISRSDRDQAVHSLVDKLDQVYGFMIKDDTLSRISLTRGILGQISQQTLGCARFIRDYSETKSFWKRLRKDMLAGTNNEIQRYNDVLDALMQNFRDQVTRDVAIYTHHTGELLDLSGITRAAGAGRDTRKQCLQGTRTKILFEITDWVNSTGNDVPCVLWLSGPAGKGKSVLSTLDKTLFDGYVKPKAATVAVILREGILDKDMDWCDTPQPTEVRPYIYKALMDLVEIHTQISHVAENLFERGMYALIENVAQDALISFKQVKRFSMGPPILLHRLPLPEGHTLIR
ncbi:hypothetical protein C8R48DRAFT_773077 [Suillus tomentosus]|nr:hypothetical protein C8R48DRAFT_773077 [Suillus tomentosus]